MSVDDLMSFGSSSALKMILMMNLFSKGMNEYTFDSPNVRKFIESTDYHFDVIVAEDFYAESLYMFAHKHNAPLVTICKFV